MPVRLQKFLADSGVSSRRKCEELIKSGRVSVDGIIVTEMGVKIDPLLNSVELDGNTVAAVTERVYIALNKPAGYITSAKDQFGRPTVLDLLDGIVARVFPVGRLDYDTSGLLFLTNDGSFAYKLTHPKHNIEKTYFAEVEGRPSDSALNMLIQGIKLDDGMTAPAKANIVTMHENTALITITITEGRNRQVRRMFEAVGHKVLSLHRVSVGGVELGGLETGSFRHLSRDEVNCLIGGFN